MTTNPSTTTPKKKRSRWTRKLRNWIVGLTGPWAVRAWISTVRFRIAGSPALIEQVRVMPPSGIYVLWHEHVLVMSGHFRDRPFRVLVSQHGDGEMIARIIAGLGMKPVRGSSTRGGARAVMELLKDKGENGTLLVAITPDGPRGPRHVVQDGAIFLASRTGLPIYPVSARLRRFISLPTWDSFVLPLPFSRGVVHLGDPIPVPPDLDKEGLESFREEVERRLRELTETTIRDFEELYRKASRP